MTDEPADAHTPRPEESRPVEPKPVKVGRALVIFVIAAAALAFSGVTSREHDAEKLAKRTNQLAIPTVALAEPQRATEGEKLVLPGDVEAYYAAQIHSQVEGYVHEWRYDIGAKVRQGDILAVVDTPEIDQRITEFRRRTRQGEGQSVAGADHRGSLEGAQSHLRGVGAGNRREGRRFERQGR